jgi:hypothetical protein
VPPLHPPRRFPPSQARGGWGVPAARILAAALLACAAAGAAAPAAAGARGIAAPPAAAAAPGGWQRPVSGPLTRPFDYAGDPFVAGRHRGVDLAARPGTPVRSACSGRVAFAGVAGANGPAVSVRCGRWRVAYLPLRTLAVRRGAHVARGALLGTAAGSGPHGGLHVGVRREGSRWGYVDPLPFFATAGEPPLAPPLRPFRPTSSQRPVPAAPRPLAPRAASFRLPEAVAGPARLHRPVGVLRPASLRPEALPARPPWPAAVAPWPAWAGLALVLAGSCGAGAARRRRGARPRRRAVMARVARE